MVVTPALYDNFCEVLPEFPSLARRLGWEIEQEAIDNGLLVQIQQLSIEKQTKLIQGIMAGWIGNGRSTG